MYDIEIEDSCVLVPNWVEGVGNELSGVMGVIVFSSSWTHVLLDCRWTPIIVTDLNLCAINCSVS